MLDSQRLLELYKILARLRNDEVRDFGKELDGIEHMLGGGAMNPEIAPEKWPRIIHQLEGIHKKAERLSQDTKVVLAGLKKLEVE